MQDNRFGCVAGKAGRRCALTLALAFGLSACQTTNPIKEIASVVAPEPVAILDGTMTVAAPAQYCVDRASLQEANGAAFILMGRCSAISTVPPAVISLAIGAQGSGSVMAGEGAQLAAYMTSEAGRASVSRSGQAKDVQIRKAASSGGALFLLVEDRAVGRYWRGMAPVLGRLVSVSAIGPDLTPEQGRPLVEKAIKVLRRRNPAS